MDPENPADLGRLQTAVRYANQQLQKFRTTRLSIIKQLVGKHYATGGSDLKIALPMLRMAATIHNRRLVIGKSTMKIFEARKITEDELLNTRLAPDKTRPNSFKNALEVFGFNIT